MGVYYSQALTASGDADALAEFASQCLVVDAGGAIVGLELGGVLRDPDRKDPGLPDDDVLDDFAAETVDGGKIVLRFTTKGAPVTVLIKGMGRAFPALDFRLAGIDDGYETPFVIAVKGEAYSERIVRETRALTDEIMGPRRDPTRFAVAGTTIYPLRVWLPHHLLARGVLRRRIADYPDYRPPTLGLAYLMSTEQAHANLEHFLATRLERRENLRRFLKTFGVDLDGSDAGLGRLNRWIARYGAYLPARVHDQSFEAHMPPWIGPRLGFNAIFDLGTFLGDVVIERNPGFRWGLFLSVRPSRQRDDPGFQRLSVLPPAKGRQRSVGSIEAVDHACRMLDHAIEFEGAGLTRKQKKTFRSAASRIVHSAANTAKGARWND